MASEKVSRKMVLEIKYVNANNAVIHTENLVTGILAKISLGTGIWTKFRLGTRIWYPPSRPSNTVIQKQNDDNSWLFFWKSVLKWPAEVAKPDRGRKTKVDICALNWKRSKNISTTNYRWQPSLRTSGGICRMRCINGRTLAIEYTCRKNMIDLVDRIFPTIFLFPIN